MTRRKFISDSTPLIALARIGQVDLVRQAFREVLIPHAVYNEVAEAREYGTGAREVAEAEWIHTVRANDRLVGPLLLVVDRGEAEAIVVAQEHPGSLLLTDDRKARRVAKHMGIEVQGSLGVLRRAKNLGVIPHIRPLATELQSTGWRISDEILEEFLRRIGE